MIYKLHINYLNYEGVSADDFQFIYFYRYMIRRLLESQETHYSNFCRKLEISHSNSSVIGPVSITR